MESKIVGVVNALSQCLWQRCFIEGRGYAVEEIYFYHYNINAMLMENNGKYSNTKQKNNIQVRYLFIKDCIHNEVFYLKYCPTGEMYADFFTKPLQGATFRQFRDMIQGTPKRIPDVEMRFPLAMAKVTSQECVGQSDNQTQGTATMSTDAHRGTFMDARGILCTYTQKRGSTSKDALGSTCT